MEGPRLVVDSVQYGTEGCKVFCIPVISDEYNQECLALHVILRIRAEQVVMLWRICLLHKACPVTSVLTTDQGLLPNHHASGSKVLVCRHNTSSLAAFGEMGIAKDLTENCVVISL